MQRQLSAQVSDDEVWLDIRNGTITHFLLRLLRTVSI